MERLQIGENIVVTVLEIRGNRVRIGIDAPKEIGVLRTELQHTDSELPPRFEPIAIAPVEL
jgi:carbon storage regulator